MKTAKKILVGIGGRGCNFIFYAYIERFANKKIKMAIINTEFKKLRTYPKIIEKVLIKKTFDKEISTKKQIDLVYNITMKKRYAINNLFKDTKISYIIAGLGGVAGSGITPAIIDIAKKNKNIVIPILTTPFYFEGQNRKKIAENSLQAVKNKSDIVIIFDNNKLFTNNNQCSAIGEVFRNLDEKIIELIQIIDKKLYRYNYNIDKVKHELYNEDILF